jgi:hypothetical protein
VWHDDTTCVSTIAYGSQYLSLKTRGTDLNLLVVNLLATYRTTLASAVAGIGTDTNQPLLAKSYIALLLLGGNSNYFGTTEESKTKEHAG